MQDLTRRLAVSSISIAIVFCLLFFAYQSLFQYVVAAVIALIAAVAIWEYEQFAKAKGGQVILPALISITVLVVLSFFAAAAHPSLRSLPLIVFFLGYLVIFALHFRQKNGAVVDL